ncbi:hypothetical protein DACRYDRAFT_103788 [Dacryopinax primogenitus]|uniref:RRN6 beta-propeller domain-containing protein n=1 Tax=Dacryopinax primogenitus (strain DJM 731) TaxID=1858805 RepID=M5G963_DACPD|nr:uncharacterized protein DACRYDRAFT_103788 [Dacryopinax primogenitus]EJU05294.1 hypothetical protein DACRYDRAFT_103788 [Dacryopinax primogenitus]
MESWTFDLRPKVAADKKSGNRKSDGNKSVESRNALDVGSRGVAALRRSQDGRLQWKFAAEPAAQEERWSTDTASVVKVFPSTAPPVSTAPGLTAHTTADDALQFMYSHYPDVMGFPTDLLENAITADRKVLLRSPFDVYRGNRMAASTTTGKSVGYGYLAWAMGYNMQSLSTKSVFFTIAYLILVIDVTSILHEEESNDLTMMPHATPVKTMDTPIQQVAFKDTTEDAGNNNLLGVRTISGTHIFQVNIRGERPNDVVVESLGELTSVHTSGRRHVDVAIAPSPDLNVVVVDDGGTVHRWSTEQLAAYPQTVEGSLVQDRFHKVAILSNPEQIVLAGCKRLQHLDFRAPLFTSFYDIPEDESDMITNIEVMHNPELICVTSTNTISWLDTRFTGRPLLTWKHRRAWDRGLITQTIGNSSERLVFLWSRSHSLITVYDLLLSQGMIETKTNPYVIPSSVTQEDCAGFAVLPATGQRSGLMFDMSERGSIHTRTLGSPSAQSTHGAVSVHWLDDVQELDEDALKLAEDLGPFAERSNIIVDLREVYETALCRPAQLPLAKDALQEVAQVLQKMPTVVQRHDVPFEHVLTDFDLAFLSVDHHPSRRRSDFLTESSLSRVPAPAEFLLDKVKDMSLSQSATWSCSHAAFIRQTNNDVAEQIDPITYLLKDSVIKQPPLIPPARESAAASMLALDLGLSDTVYFSEVLQSPQSSRREYQDLESATMALSLENPTLPAPVFGHLRPRERPSVDDLQTPRSRLDEPFALHTNSIKASLGASLLLSEWLPGSVPEDYEYVDPYGVAEHEPRQPRTPRQGDRFDHPGIGGASVSQAGPGGPPAIVAVPSSQSLVIPNVQSGAISSTQPFHSRRAFPSSPPPAPFSQLGYPRLAAALPPSSQDLWPSTQQVRGPFGERPEARLARKKAAKKRMAGF